MEMNLSLLLILVSFFIFLGMILRMRVTTLLKSTSEPKLNLPPGPRKLPVIGNLHLLATSQPPHHTLTNLALQHGPMMLLQLGEVSTLVISSPEGAKEVLQTHDVIFASRPSLFTGEILTYNNTDIAFAPYGDYWRQLRKICSRELLSKSRVEYFRPIRGEEFSNMCRWIDSKAGSVINLTERVKVVTLDAATIATIGKRASDQTTLISLLEEGADLLTGFGMADMFPSIKLLRLFSETLGRAPRVHEMTDEILDSIVNDHKVAIPEWKNKEDLLDVLLKFNEPGQEFYLTVDSIKAVLQDMFGAGIEPISTTIDWAMAEMIRHPRVLKKAQDEVRRVFGEKGFVDESDFGELQYVKLVIKETLRMHPPAPLLLPRENCEHCKIHGYDVPAKTRVLVNVWAIGRDPKHWKEAQSFLPERYVDNPIDYSTHDFEYLPFGGGRRICPGISLGLASVELPLAMLLYHFDWALPDGVTPENVDMTEAFGLTTRRKNPLCVIPITKQPLHL